MGWVKCMKKNGYTGVELLIVIIVLGVVTFGILATTSSSFKDNTEDLYSETKYLIENQAELYGESDGVIAELQEKGNKVISVNDLVVSGYYVADDKSGNVIDPRNNKSTLNNLKIKLSYVDGVVTASIIEEA